MGAYNCNEGEDQWNFISRLVRAFTEHMIVATLNCASDGYDDHEQFEGARPDYGWEGYH